MNCALESESRVPHLANYDNAEYFKNNQFGFRYREISPLLTPDEQLKYSNTITFNAIFFVLEGELNLSWGEYKNVGVKAGEMYFLPRGATVSACVVSEHLSYLVARMEHQLDEKAFGDLVEIKNSNEIERYEFAPMQIKSQMSRFVDSVKDYLLQGVDNTQLHNIKLLELQFILRGYYSAMECALLLYPMIGNNSEFEYFVLNNYSLSTDIEELASKANMGRSTFDRKFKETFGITPLKWIESQTRQKIINKASEPNVTVKDIMYDIGIYNASQFTKLCKRICGVAPSLLIRAR